MLPYEKENVPLARCLRKNMTPWERRLWYGFLRTYPIRFQRQKVLGHAIADFYCVKAHLVLELDGGGHFEPVQQEKDAARTAELETMGLWVFRVSNLEVDRNFQGICEAIDQAVQARLRERADGK